MKKLLTLILLFTITLYSIPTQAALTPPALFDYSFAFNATDGEFQFSDGINTFTPEFTRTANGNFFDFEFIGDADGLLPFEIELFFRRANTSFTFGTTGFIATDTKIGSNGTVGTDATFAMRLNNQTKNPFFLFYDMSDGFLSGNHRIQFFYDNFKLQSNGADLRVTNGVLIQHYIPTFVDVFLQMNPRSSAEFLTALYLVDLGTSPAFNDGFAEGFDDGFADGLIEGFDNGVASDTSFAVGFAQGLLQGGDMETGSSLLILIVALIGFGMMIFGFITKRGIFNLLSVAAFIVLGGLLAEFIGFIIITFALVFINVYYAFFGDL